MVRSRTAMRAQGDALTNATMSRRSARPTVRTGTTTRVPVDRLRLTHGYPRWFYIPAAVVFGLMFVAPTAISLFYAFTRWTLFEWEWIGLENFRQFFRVPALSKGLRNTVVYAVVTSGLKVILGMALAVLCTSPKLHIKGAIRSIVFFPVLVSTVAVGITFERLMHPSTGLINQALGRVGIDGPRWLTDPQIALLSVALVDVWQGVGLALVIFIAGILSVPKELYQSVAVDGGGSWDRFRHVILPLSKPATFTVILLSFVGGLRRFDLIWTMTGGGPGFTTDVLASTVYKQYQAGFYGLSTAGNVVLLVLVTCLVFPLNWFMRRREVDR
jgi:raffinose/stachyose/melibiose transport system permease protein